MKNYIVKILIFSIFPIIATSCQGYLQQSPDSDIDIKIDSEQQIAQLLTGAYPTASYFSFLETRTDNVDERIDGTHYKINEAMYYWQDYDQDDLDTPLNYWNACYKGIAQANKALELLSKYPKTDHVKALYAEAFLLRAYLHFMLVNIWSQPYSPSKSKTDLGIPYLTKPEKHGLVNYQRGTVEQVYTQIEEDLKYGLSLVDDTYYTHPKYHFNKKAAYAFASRFYLITGDWQKVIDYSNYVLGYDPSLVLRRWNNYLNNFYFNRQMVYTRYISTDEKANLLLTNTQSRIARDITNQKFGVTKQSVDKVFNGQGIEGSGNNNKLKMQGAYPFINNSELKNAMYICKFDERSTDMSYSLRPTNLYVTNVLFSTDEVMLNRIEAYAMTHDYENAINNLIIYCKTKFDMDLSSERDAFLQTSTDNYNTITPYYGMSIKQLALIKTVLMLRQQEFLHEGLRWFDIRRFYLPVKRTSKYKYYRALEKQDLRKVLQIPSKAIRYGLQENPRYKEDNIVY